MSLSFYCPLKKTKNLYTNFPPSSPPCLAPALDQYMRGIVVTRNVQKDGANLPLPAALANSWFPSRMSTPAKATAIFSEKMERLFFVDAFLKLYKMYIYLNYG